jgi:hypothetical protein
VVTRNVDYGGHLFEFRRSRAFRPSCADRHGGDGWL